MREHPAPDLFWGPAHALAFIRMQRPVDDSGWLDDVWVEGGALLDLDQKKFLLFGGEDVAYNVPLRRVYMEMLAQVWTGWTVRWAHEGIADLADYVKYPREKVLNPRSLDARDLTLTPPEERDWTDLVASVRLEDGTLRLYPLAGDMPSYLSSGPQLAENLSRAPGLPLLRLDEWTQNLPGGGFHIDIAGRRLDFWMAEDAPGFVQRVAGAWPGWETHWHQDRYERQLERTEGSLRFPIRDRQALLDSCRAMLLWEPAGSPVDTLQMLANREHQQGNEVQIHPWALCDDRPVLSREERIAILEATLSRSRPS